MLFDDGWMLLEIALVLDFGVWKKQVISGILPTVNKGPIAMLKYTGELKGLQV